MSEQLPSLTDGVDLSPPNTAVPASGVTLDAIQRMAEASDTLIARLRNVATETEARRDFTARGYTITEVAKLLNRTAEGIRKAEKAGKLEPPALRENGRRQPYSLSQINAMRDLWNLRPGRGEGDEPIRLSFANFKGGVGKTTLSCHCAQYLARAGYRVLLIDCDSQGSATMTFGYRPDEDFTHEDTLLPYLTGEHDDIAYAVKPTHWDGLDLVPANLELYSAEYALMAEGAREGGEWLGRLDRGIRTVEGAYDVVVIDPPPALGAISLSVLRSIDGLIVPTPPAMYDFHSTSSFFSMLCEVMEQIEQSLGEPVELDFLKVVVSKHVAGRPSHDFVATLMQEVYGNSMLKNAFVASAEIDNAASEWHTVYDLTTHTASRQTYRRCIESLDAVFGEIESLIKAIWQARRSERMLSNNVRTVAEPTKGQGAHADLADA